MLNRIDRYVSAYFWGYFIASLIVFVTLFVAVDVLTTTIQYQVSGAILLRYFGFYIPEFMYRMMPVACLMATIMTLSTLQRGNELIALFSVGMSLTRVSLPILASVLFNCALVLYMSDQLLPRFVKEKNYVLYHEIRKNPSLYSTVKTDRIWYRSKDMIFNIKVLNEKTHKAQGLSLYFFNPEWDLIQMITAKEVDLQGAQWHLKDGTVTIFSEESSFPLTSKFKQKTIIMGEDAKDLGSTANTSEILSLGELSAYIQKNKEAGLDTLRYEVDYHSKYGFALAGLVMALLGIPFSVGGARSGGIMGNVGKCIGLVFVYWLMYSSALTLGNHGQIPPFLAAWLPNGVFVAFAVFAIHRLKR